MANYRTIPKSIHCQVEAVLKGKSAIGQKKQDALHDIRSINTLNTYRKPLHLFAKFAKAHGCNNIFETQRIENLMKTYFGEMIERYVKEKRSFQTIEKYLSAISMFASAINKYIENHHIPAEKMDVSGIIKDIKRSAKNQGILKTSRLYSSRAYPDPEGLIAAISSSKYRLMARIQIEGGCRTEGVGAAENGLNNPLTMKHLGGIVADPVTGKDVGLIGGVIEKGGKATDHFVTVETYGELEEHIERYGSLESDYKGYLAAINQAAKDTGQYARGRGTHGLKHVFVQRRYAECVEHGLSHHNALQRASSEAAHRRMRITYTYTRG